MVIKLRVVCDISAQSTLKPRVKDQAKVKLAAKLDLLFSYVLQYVECKSESMIYGIWMYEKSEMTFSLSVRSSNHIMRMCC